MTTPAPKITFIGAGSTVFTRNLLGDILSFPELAQAHIALHDIDGHRLELSRLVAHRVADALGVRRAAVEGANFVINTIQVGGTSLPPSSISRSPRSTVSNRPLATPWA